MLLSRFCLNKEGRGGQEFRSLEVRRKLIALKKPISVKKGQILTRKVSVFRPWITPTNWKQTVFYLLREANFCQKWPTDPQRMK